MTIISEVDVRRTVTVTYTTPDEGTVGIRGGNFWHRATVTCLDPTEVSSEAWAGRSGRCADLRDCDYGAERDVYAGAGV